MASREKVKFTAAKALVSAVVADGKTNVHK